MSRTLSFFAVVKEEDDEHGRAVRVIPVTQSLQNELSAELEAQRDHFPFPPPAATDTRPRRALQRIAFDPGYTPSDDEIPYIDSYTPPAAFLDALRNPLAQQELDTKQEALKRIAGIFTGQAGDQPWLVAQAFDRRRLLSAEGFTIIHAQHEFRRLLEPGLTLDTKAAARWQEGRLEFTSFNVAHRIFDLSAYFHEATDAELNAMATDARVFVSDVTAFVGQADSWIRRKVSLIRHSGVLAKQTPQKIAQSALDYDIEIPIRRVGRTQKIALPADKKALKDVLRFLDEDYFTAVLSRRRYYTNSKTPV